MTQPESTRIPILTLLLVVALAGCGNNGEGGGATAPPPAATSNQIHPVARDMLRDGGTFTWALNSMPPNFNYNEIDGTLADNFYVVGAMMPSTFHSTADATPEWNRNYLASDPVLETVPRQVVTYRIHPDAAWYDGTPLTWEDFYWQWRANNGEDPAWRIASSNGYANIASVERGADDKEVVVTFAEPFADWQALFNPIYPASTNSDPEVFNDGWRERPLTTAGPFKLDEIDVTSKTITLVRNEKWWGPPAKLDQIVFRVIETDAQIDALANGEIDAMDIGPDANGYNRALGIASAEVRVAGGPNFRHITINGTSPKLSDVRVRRALALGIDRQVIARALLGPLGIAPEPLDNHIFMRNQHGYQDNTGDLGVADPARAGELLDEAGWRLEGDVRQKDGEPLEVRFVIPAAISTSRQEAELVQNMLAQIGVRVSISTVPLDDFFDRYIRPGQFDLTVFSWLGTSFPISSSKSIYAKPTLGPDGEMDIQQNYARIGSDAIDDLFNRAAQEFDREEAIELANLADALIWQEVHSLTMYQRPELIATKRTLANFGAFGFADWVYEDIGWTE